MPPGTAERRNESLIPVVNSPALQVPLWLGPLNASEREEWRRQGREVIRLDGLRPWEHRCRCSMNSDGAKCWAGWNGHQQHRTTMVAKGLPTAALEGRGPVSTTTMRLLMVHQNFPGQFRDLGPAYATAAMS